MDLCFPGIQHHPATVNHVFSGESSTEISVENHPVKSSSWDLDGFPQALPDGRIGKPEDADAGCP
jgi:hypothetical protein